MPVNLSTGVIKPSLFTWSPEEGGGADDGLLFFSVSFLSAHLQNSELLPKLVSILEWLGTTTPSFFFFFCGGAAIHKSAQK